MAHVERACPNAKARRAHAAALDRILACAMEGDSQLLAELLAAHPEIDLDAEGPKHAIALHQACIRGALKCARLLLAAGASPSLPDHYGWTPLHYIAAGSARRLRQSPHADLIDPLGAMQALSAAGAELDALDSAGCSPFLTACLFASLDEAQSLLDLGASFAARCAGGLDAKALVLSRWGDFPPGSEGGQAASLMLGWLDAETQRREIRLAQAGSEEAPSRRNAPLRL